MNKSNNSVNFFDNAAKGLYEPIVEATKELDMYDREEYVYNLYQDKFDKHINASIPLYFGTQLATIHSVSKIAKNNNITILDIGSSNGTWGKTLAYLNQNITVHSLDPNDNMSVEDNMYPFNFKEIKESFVYKCCDKKIFNNEVKYDVIKESMAFQFISDSRDKLVKAVNSMLKDDGIFISEEKFILPNLDYRNNEELKDKYKAKHFKAKDIAEKKDNILGELSSNQVKYSKYIKVLLSNFKYIKTYYKAGNFIGVVASNSRVSIANFCKNITKELKKNNYNSEKSNVIFITNPKKIKKIHQKIVKSSIHLLEPSIPPKKDILFAISNKQKDCLAILMKDGTFRTLEKAEYSLDIDWWDISMKIRCNYCDAINKKAYLDCYDEPHLMDVNKKYGFKIDTIVPFDGKYAVNSWKSDKFLATRPNVIFMSREPENAVYCIKCSSKLIPSSNSDYKWQCLECDEDFYKFEVRR